jgi:N-methylhydantoinase B
MVVTGDSIRTSIDPITFAVVRHGLIAANRLAATALERSAMMPLIYEGHDYATSYFDSRGELLAESSGHPLFAGSLTFTVPAVIEAVGPDRLRPGDMLVTNLPHLNGSHPADGVLVEPVFVEGEIVGYFSARAHMGDIGGLAAFPANTVESLQEGLMLPPMKFAEAGKLDEKIIEIIRANSRTPEVTAGDFLATSAAVRTGAEAVRVLVAKYGVASYRAITDEILDHGERLVRRGLESIPDGVYAAEGALDDNGVELGRPVALRVTVTVEGSNMTIDLTGSAPEQHAPINSPWPYTQAIAHMALKTLTSPDIPCNAGERRALTLIAPEGSIFNSRPGAASFRAVQPASLLSELILHAVAPACADRVPAMSGVDGASVNALLDHPDSARPSVMVYVGGHGQGAKNGADGGNALAYRMSCGVRLEPTEVVEARHPVIRHRLELDQDSGGAGKWRGGLGVINETEYLSTGVGGTGGDISSGATAISGLCGGAGPRRQNGVISYYGSDHELGPPSCKRSDLPISAGDRVLSWTAGGGGYGEPHERPIAAVVMDVENEYISRGAAKDIYGVAIRENGQVDESATEKLRETPRWIDRAT